MDIPLELTGPDVENNARTRLVQDEYCEIITIHGLTRRAKWDKRNKTFLYIGTQYPQPVLEDEIAEWVKGSVRF
ncbi:hypothetical protein GCM10011396_46080 [Undibacterium terreum]|uniref:Uncharacterized protein n=1 Tax=Undibacterium terreum TaxID=1224302 RepID=A0A916UYI5_9BURK|nr:hypothetical protein GCM10011396_46080 [Undibacterium terreum]